MPGSGIYKDNWHISHPTLPALLQQDEECEGCGAPGVGTPRSSAPWSLCSDILLILCPGIYCRALGNSRQDLGLKKPEVSLAEGSRSVLHLLSNPVCTREADPIVQL